MLHASAVRVDDEAVGIIGAKGAGKSTTSAALHHYGCPVITDDLLALRSGGDDLIADPSFPRFKLWPDAAKAALNDDPTTLSPLHVRVQKRARLARQGFSTDPLPLKVLYVLSGGQSLRLDALRGAQALTHLLPHAYNNPLVSAIGSPAIRQWHFEACASLTQRVPVHLLQRPADLDRLAEIAEAIIQDARQLP